MNKVLGHLKVVMTHRHYVRKFCFKCGLYKQGIAHDLSKYSPTEFWGSVKYFTGNRSPIDNEKDIKGYSLAWFHHKGRNPHHWEYWIDNVGTYSNNPARIPYRYVVEMICDWLAAGITYSKQDPDYNAPYSVPYNHYIKHVDVRIFHPDTQDLIETFLGIISSQGINVWCKGVRENKWDFIRKYKEGEIK